MTIYPSWRARFLRDLRRHGWRSAWAWALVGLRSDLGRLGCYWCACGRIEKLFHRPVGDHSSCPPF